MDRAFVHSQAKLPAAQAAQIFHSFLDFVPQIQQTLGVIAQEFARVGELDLASSAHEQRLADRFFELTDDNADRGLRAVELLRGAGKALFFRDGQECLQLG